MAIARRKAGYRTRLTGLVTCYGRRGGEPSRRPPIILPCKWPQFSPLPFGERTRRSLASARVRGQRLLKIPPHPSRHATCATPLRFARKSGGSPLSKGERRNTHHEGEGTRPSRDDSRGHSSHARGWGGVSRGHYFGVQRALPGFDANLRPAHHNRKSYLPMSQIRKTYRPSRRESPASTRASARAAPLAACVRNPAPL